MWEVCISFSVLHGEKMNLTKIEKPNPENWIRKLLFFINVANEWHPVLSNNALEELKSLGTEVKF